MASDAEEVDDGRREEGDEDADGKESEGELRKPEHQEEPGQEESDECNAAEKRHSYLLGKRVLRTPLLGIPIIPCFPPSTGSESEAEETSFLSLDVRSNYPAPLLELVPLDLRLGLAAEGAASVLSSSSIAPTLEVRLASSGISPVSPSIA